MLDARRLHSSFQKLYSGVIYDAMKFDMDWEHEFCCTLHRDITRLGTRHQTMVGHAFTCRGSRVKDPSELDDHKRIDMLEMFTAGCVFVLDTGGDDQVAHFGDISARLAGHHGAAGAVLDGYTRDAKYIKQMPGFTLFCRGTQPQDAYGHWQIDAWQCPIEIAGSEDCKVQVCPEDIIFADDDGVLMIPHARAEEVLEKAKKRASKEEDIRFAVDTGQDPRRIYKEHDRW